MKQYYVYILCNKYNEVFYIGITNDLIRRIYEHKNNLLEGFSKKYNIHKLVYYEMLDNANDAIEREKQLKNWHRDWKINLIQTINSELKDLYEDITR